MKTLESSPKNSGSAPKTSEPPRASSWATPPEFYLDENSVSRSVRHFLTGLEYAVHTPGEVFGSWEEAYGAADTEWLRRIAGTGWAVTGRDAKIAERPYELAAYEAARVHMFLLPGEATRQVTGFRRPRPATGTAAVQGLSDWKPEHLGGAGTGA